MKNSSAGWHPLLSLVPPTVVLPCEVLQFGAWKMEKLQSAVTRVVVRVIEKRVERCILELLKWVDVSAE